MSFTRFLSWLAAVLLAAGGALIATRYAFDISDWGTDGFWAVAAAILFTRQIQDALEDMWGRLERAPSTELEGDQTDDG